jgi:hypothetical protein
MNRIEIDLEDDVSRRLWHAVGDFANRLPGEWVLIGGLMVQLHALEHGVTGVRVTRDIDVLGQARPPGALRAIDEFLRREGFEPTFPDLDGFAHRYERGDLVVDVLAPDGLNPPPELSNPHSRLRLSTSVVSSDQPRARRLAVCNPKALQMRHF